MDKDANTETTSPSPLAAESLIVAREKHRFLLLRFPPRLEQRYQMHQAKHAALDFRYRSIVILVLYTSLSTGVAVFLSSEQLVRWFSVYCGVGIIVILAGFLSNIRALDRWFNWYTAVGSMISVGLSVAASNMIGAGQSAVISHVGIIYAVIIIYAFVGMRFYYAVAAGWLGGLLGLYLTLKLDGHLDWQLLHRTYTGMSVLGMCLAYANDHRNRVNFVQACALEESHRRSELQNQKLKALSREDGLTGLANRRYLDAVLLEEWNRALRQKLPIALLMIDVDYFKPYNDHLGHPAGDVCLREIAKVIKIMARRSGDMAARYGGEEFALVYPATTAQQALSLAKQLLLEVASLQLPHPASPLGAHVTVSIGVAAMIPSAYQKDSPILVDYADQALYTAKQKGRNGCVLYSATQERDQPLASSDSP